MSKDNPPQSVELNLSDLIHQIRDELVESEKRRKTEKKDPLFQLDEMELEIHFGVTKEMGGNGKVKFSVMTLAGEFGGSGGVQSEKVQTIRLKFKCAEIPEDSDGKSNGGNNGDGKKSNLPPGAMPHYVQA